MQISKRQINPEFEKKLKVTLAQLIADIANQEKAQDFLKDFLSETEYVALAKRLAIMMYLNKGRSYEEIKDEIKVSSATIASIQSLLEKKSKGIRLAVKLIKAEEWATKWTDKISGFFGKS